MKISIITIFIFLVLNGCNSKEEQQTLKDTNTNHQNYKQFVPPPKNTSDDDRSPIRYQK
jgi:PBP1b-binding outer membrane lipoprotein LpoB